MVGRGCLTHLMLVGVTSQQYVGQGVTLQYVGQGVTSCRSELPRVGRSYLISIGVTLLRSELPWVSQGDALRRSE